MDKDDKILRQNITRAKTGTTELNKMTSNMSKTSSDVNMYDKSIDNAANHYMRVRVMSKKVNTSANKRTRMDYDRYDAESSSSDGKYF
jgi:hypothetical protein